MAGLNTLLRAACLWTVLVFCACNTAAALPLWELEGTSNRIQLLGSIHFLRSKDYPLPQAILDAYQEADVIVMELVLDEIAPADMQRVQQELAIDPRGRRLSDLIGASAYRQATAQASAISIDLDLLQPFEPWFAALQITQLRLLQLGFDGSYGVDMTMTRNARADGKPIIGLETLDEQLRTLDSLSAPAQKRFFGQTLEEAASIGDDLEKIVIAWRQGDTQSLETLLFEGLDDQPEVYEQVLVQRNRRWTKAILNMTNDSPDYLIIVGTLHLIGEDSVRNMLGEAGIRSHQIHQ